MNLGGTIRRRHRKSFERFLHHEDSRIRAVAEEMLKEDAAERAFRRAMYECDEVLTEEWLSQVPLQVDAEEGEGAGETDDPPADDEIPF